MKAVKQVKNTNLKVQYDEEIDRKSPGHLYSLIRADDQMEVKWMIKQRPLQNMIHPAEAFNQGIKSLRPAVMFNTFDLEKAKSRRLHNQTIQAKRTKEYRAKNVKASEVLKALGDRKKLVVRDTVDEFESDPVLKRLPGRKFKNKEDLAAIPSEKGARKAGKGGKGGKMQSKKPKTAIGKGL